MKLIALLIPLALTGCASLHQVLIPVSAPCEQVMPQRPTYRYAPGTYTQVFPLVQDLLSDRELATAHIVELEGVVSACIKK